MDSSVAPACDAQFRAGWAQDGNLVDVADAREHINALDHVDGLQRFGTYQCKHQKKVSWDIPDASLVAQGHKVMKQFQVGSSVWHMTLQGIGSLENGHLALKIDCGDMPELPSNWFRDVSCRVVLVNKQSENPICKCMGFASAHEDMDLIGMPKGWMFPQFASLKRVVNSQSGFVRENRLMLRVKILIHENKLPSRRRTRARIPSLFKYGVFAAAFLLGQGLLRFGTNARAEDESEEPLGGIRITAASYDLAEESTVFGMHLPLP